MPSAASSVSSSSSSSAAFAAAFAAAAFACFCCFLRADEGETPSAREGNTPSTQRTKRPLPPEFVPLPAAPCRRRPVSIPPCHRRGWPCPRRPVSNRSRRPSDLITTLLLAEQFVGHQGVALAVGLDDDQAAARVGHGVLDARTSCAGGRPAADCRAGKPPRRARSRSSPRPPAGGNSWISRSSAAGSAVGRRGAAWRP